MTGREFGWFRSKAIAAIMTLAVLGAGCLSNEWPPCPGDGTGYFDSRITSLDPPGYHTPQNTSLPYVPAGTKIEATVEPPECGGPPEEYVWELYSVHEPGSFSREYRSFEADVRVTVPYVGYYALEPSFINPDGERVYRGNVLDIRADHRFESDLPAQGLETNFTTFCCPWNGYLNITSEGVGPEATWTARVLVDRTDELLAEKTVPTGQNQAIIREDGFSDVLGGEWLESIRVEIEPVGGVMAGNPLRDYRAELLFDVGPEPITYGP